MKFSISILLFFIVGVHGFSQVKKEFPGRLEASVRDNVSSGGRWNADTLFAYSVKLIITASGELQKIAFSEGTSTKSREAINFSFNEHPITSNEWKELLESLNVKDTLTLIIPFLGRQVKSLNDQDSRCLNYDQIADLYFKALAFANEEQASNGTTIILTPSVSKGSFSIIHHYRE